MKPESIEKFKILLKEYLEKDNSFLYPQIMYGYTITKEKKGTRDDYALKIFVKEYSLPTQKESQFYKIWKFIYQKDISLAYEIVTSYIKYPAQEYDRKKYIKSIFELYTNNKKDNKIFWSIVNTKVFLNNNIELVQDFFEDKSLNHIQKKEVVEYYVKSLKKNNKLNTLENQRIITLLNANLLKPLTNLENLIDEKELRIHTTTEKCIYFEITIKELMEYSLKLSDKFSEHLLSNFSELLPQVVESETSDVINRKKENKKIIEGYDYAVLTKLEEIIIKTIFTNFVDNYIKIIETKPNYPTKEDLLDCLQFAVIKARKENLENNLVIKNQKSTLHKI